MPSSRVSDPPLRGVFVEVDSAFLENGQAFRIRSNSIMAARIATELRFFNASRMR
jgi:hypothetical protein